MAHRSHRREGYEDDRRRQLRDVESEWRQSGEYHDGGRRHRGEGERIHAPLDASSSSMVNSSSTSSSHKQQQNGKRTRLDDGADVERAARSPEDTTANGDGEYEIYTEEDEARLVEERRKRRRAILEKHISTGTPGSSAVATPSAQDNSPAPPPVDELQIDSDSATLELGKDKKEAAASAQNAQATEMSAAEYDPKLDRALDKEREDKLLGGGGDAAGSAVSLEGNKASHAQHPPTMGEDENEDEYEEIEVDDDDDIDDMFAIDVSDEPKKKKTIRVKKDRKIVAANVADAPATVGSSAAVHDNWDEPDGYYRITLGERIGEGGRYQVFANLGRGMFSAVVRARDTQEGDREVAIKVIRSQESMYKAGLKEISILQRLAALDPEGKRHVIRLLGHFTYRNHLCMVFESLSMNLREVIRRFGKDVGLNLRAVRTYAHQMFFALALMRKAEVMHADLKPDNILVNESKTVLRVCDLGSASDLSEMEITPYLVSRFYRAPEIILGLPYDCALDMWSIGCTLFELFTGRILFPGKSNNHMLFLMQELKGKFTTKQIRKGRFSGMHFDDQNAFVSRERDRATGSDVLRKVATFNPTTQGTDLRARLLPTSAVKGMSQTDLRLTNSFIDLLSRTLELDPARRITPNQALQHPFFSR